MNDERDPRLDPPYRPEWDRDPPWSREDRQALEQAKRPGLARGKPSDPPQRERQAG